MEKNIFFPRLNEKPAKIILNAITKQILFKMSADTEAKLEMPGNSKEVTPSHTNGIDGQEENKDEQQYLDLITKILTTGNRNGELEIKGCN